MFQSAVATVLFFLLLLRKPGYAAAALTACVFLHLPFVLPRHYGMDFVLAALVLTAIAVLLSVRYLDILETHTPRLFAAAVCVWLAANLLSVIFSASPVSSYDAFRIALPNILLAGLILWLIGDTFCLARVYDTLILASVFLAAVAIAQRLLGFDQIAFGGFGVSSVRHIANDVDEIRPGGPMGDPNFFATYLIPGALIATSRLFMARRRRRITLYALASIICVGGIIVTASRGGVLAFGLGLLFLIAFERKIWPFVLIAVAVTAFVLVQPRAYVDRFVGGFSALSAIASGEINESTVSERALAGRLGEMKAAVYIFLDKPWTGVGYGQFEDNFQAYVGRFDILMRNADRGAHSLYLEVAAEAGMVGLAALGFVIALGFGNLIAAGVAARRAEDEALYRDIRSFGIGVAFVLLSHWLLHDAKASYLWLFLGFLFIPTAIFGQSDTARTVRVGRRLPVSGTVA